MSVLRPTNTQNNKVSFARKIRTAAGGLNIEADPANRLHDHARLWLEWFNAVADFWATAYTIEAEQRNARTSINAIRELFRGTAASASTVPPTVLRSWLAKWRSYVQTHHPRWTPTQCAIFAAALVNMLLFAQEHGEDAFLRYDNPVDKAAKEIEPAQQSLSKRTLRTLHSRQQLIYGQPRAMGDLGAEERRGGRLF
ncbi:hypothetical protein JCM10207_009223 [Rhodosporidiobolus poonsookiae]